MKMNKKTSRVKKITNPNVIASEAQQSRQITRLKAGKSISLLLAMTIILSLFLIAVPMAVTAGAATPIYVNDSTGDDTNNGETPGSPVKTIARGIELVDTEGTINVAAGTYNEGDPTNQKWAIYIDKPITLLGAQAGVDARDRSGPESVIDSGNLYGVGIYIDGGYYTTSPGGSGTVIDGFEVRNSHYFDERGAGIGLEFGVKDVIIRNTYVHSNTNQGIQSFQRNESSSINDNILIEHCR